MQKLYPKIITALFFVLLVAMILKYTDSGSNTVNALTKTAQLDTGK
jgi:hypothetical protein